MSVSHKHYSELTPSGVEWLGDVPKHWEVRRLKNILRERNEKNDPIQTKEILSLTIAQGVIPYKDKEGGGNKAKDDLSSYKLAYPNDIVMNSMNVIVGAVGLSRYFGAISPVYYALYADDDSQNVHYYNQVFQSQSFQRSLLGLGNGIMMKQSAKSQKLNTIRMRIPMEKMGDVLFPLPPLPEQRAIASFLDRETGKIDRMIGKQERMIELLKEKRQAVISHAVTKGLNPNAPMKNSGIEWLGEIPEHWGVSALKFYWCVIDCKHLTAPFVDDGIPLASIKEVQSWTVNLSSAKQTTEHFYQLLIEGGRKPQTGDIIYSRNATVGEAALVTADHPKFSMGQDVCILKPQKDCSSEYYMHLLKSPVITSQLNELMVGATFKRINVENIRNFIAIHPPEKEQQAIAEYLDGATFKVDNLTAKAKQAIKLMKERRTALISAAVTGKIDVRDVVSEAGCVNREYEQSKEPALLAAEAQTEYRTGSEG